MRKQENEKLSKAKANLILDNCFFASLLLSMEFVETTEIETFDVDGETIRYSPKFLESLTVPEVTFVLAHEVMHCVFQHMFRLGEKDAETWNKATDYIINDLLTKETGVGTMPTGPNAGLLNPKLVLDGGGTADGVYKIIFQEKEKQKDQKGQKPQSGNGGGFDQLRKPTGDQSQLSQKEAEMRVKVAQARNAAKMRGQLSSGMDRLATEALKTEVDWKQVLRRFLSERAKTDLSYAKPKRRFLADDLYLPSLIGEKLGAVVIAVDCSGSINETVLGMFSAEIKSILQDVSPSEIRVMYFDTEILRTDVFSSETPFEKLSPIGGGGTAFSPIFEAVSQLETAPVACVVLTDLYCDDFGNSPDCPVLWASTTPIEKVKTPFGEKIYLKENESRKK